MKTSILLANISTFFVTCLASGPLYASFHFMQIEQVIGGVNGDPTAQAIQLRMRNPGQNFVSKARLRAWDANGDNPVVILDIDNDVKAGSAGSRVLITTPSFNLMTTPIAEPDFLLTSVIPAEYLVAGSLTWEDDFGSVLWRLSWGGEKYSGSCAGEFTNDGDGNFCPAYPGGMPTNSLQGLLFQGDTSALSTDNDNDYNLTPASAVFTNNSGSSFTVSAAAIGACCTSGGACTDSLQQSECDSLNGSWQGANSSCAGGCGPLIGACCLGEGGCKDGVSEEDCLATKGAFIGEGTSCEDAKCGPVCVADVAPPGGNGSVNVDDLLLIINSWGPCAGCPADIVSTGNVNVDDLLAVINAWGPC